MRKRNAISIIKYFSVVFCFFSHTNSYISSVGLPVEVGPLQHGLFIRMKPPRETAVQDAVGKNLQTLNIQGSDGKNPISIARWNPNATNPMRVLVPTTLVRCGSSLSLPYSILRRSSYGMADHAPTLRHAGEVKSKKTFRESKQAARRFSRRSPRLR